MVATGRNWGEGVWKGGGAPSLLVKVVGFFTEIDRSTEELLESRTIENLISNSF